MDLLEVMAKRYSVRAYKPDPVEDEKLQQILEAARLAPTATNRQPFQLIVIHTKGSFSVNHGSEDKTALCYRGELEYSGDLILATSRLEHYVR